MKSADWVLSQPWIITEEALETILAIAERRNELPEAVEARIGRPLDNSHSVVVRDGVGIIPVVGPIARYADMFSEISGATAIDTLAKDFRTCLDDRSVKAIVLNIDSPGGAVSGVAEFAGHVAAARGQGKPIVSYVGSRAQSAGYWIASAADQVVVDPTAMLGSIGAVMGVRAKSGSASTIEFVSTQSPYKRTDPATETGKAKIQATVDDLADVFVDAVAANRGVDRRKVLDDFGQGGSMVGQKAVSAGMADGVGSLEGVIACLANRQMPCPVRPPRTNPVHPPGTTTRRPSMSEHESTISAAEANELRRQIAETRQKLADAEVAAQADVKQREKAAADLQAENSRLRQEAIVKDATAFAEGEISSRRATPAEKTHLVRLYVRAAMDDSAHAEDSDFSVGQVKSTGSRVADLVAAQSSRAPHGLGTEKTTNEKVEAPKNKLGGVLHFANDEAEAASPKVPTPAGSTPTAERLAYLNSLNN